jgi:hypothetical protein
MIPDSFYGIVLEKASHLTFCPLRKRNWTSYPEELHPRDATQGDATTNRLEMYGVLARLARRGIFLQKVRYRMLQ